MESQVRDLIAELQRHDPCAYIEFQDSNREPMFTITKQPGSHAVSLNVGQMPMNEDEKYEMWAKGFDFGCESFRSAAAAFPVESKNTRAADRVRDMKAPENDDNL